MFDYAPDNSVWIERMALFLRSGNTLEGEFEEHAISITPDSAKNVHNVKVDGWLVATTADAAAVVDALIQAYEETIVEEEVEAEKEDAIEIAKDAAKTKAIEDGKKPEKVAQAILQAAMKAESADYDVDPEDIIAVVAERMEEILFACEGA